jgi:HSP20 family protein
MDIVRRDQNPERSLPQNRTWDPFDLMRDLIRWDPFRELSQGVGRAHTARFLPNFEIKETRDSFAFKADLPGIKDSELDISLTGNRLTISGERQEEKRDEGETYHAYERSYGSFSRSFTLPDGIDADRVEAELKDGVLNVVIPKKPEVQPKRIPVNLLSEGDGAAKA